MARTLLDLAKSMELRATSLSEAGSALAKRKAMAVITYLVHVTPVDTSKALSNWQLSLNVPVGSAHGAFFVGSKGSTEEASADVAINSATAKLQDKKPGDVIYISNLLPYIRELDQGSSSQSPGGFVHAARLIARKTK